MAWARTRRAGKELAHYSEAPEPLHWPDVPKKAWNMKGMVAHWRQTRRAYVHWERPAAVTLDPKRRLLATGRYADEEPAAKAALATREAAGAGDGGATRAPRAAASRKAVNKKAVGSEPRSRQSTATKKRKNDDGPDSGVEASPPTKRRSSRRGGAVLSVKA